MKGLSNRITRLESSGPTGLSLAVRQWLGHPLTDVEHAQADREREQLAETNWPTFDWTGISAEMREWLTQGDAA